MMTNNSTSLKILAYYFGATILAITLATQIGNAIDNQVAVLLGVISPALLAFLFAGLTEGKQAVVSLLKSSVKIKIPIMALLLALLSPFLLGSLAIYFSTGQLITANVATFFPKVLILLVLMTGEEIGWRGYALPRLQSHFSLLTSGFIVAVVWALWHFPGYLVGEGVPLELPFYIFVLMVIPGGILLAMLYHWTKSVFSVIAAHVSSNLMFSALPLLPEITGEQQTFVIYVVILWLVCLAAIAAHWMTRKTMLANIEAAK